MFLQIYWIDVLFALFTEKSQRAFELLSKTRVVRVLIVCVMLGVAAPLLAQSTEIGPPPGKLVDVGGRELHIHCTGAGAPTVVLEAGASSFAIDWALVQPEVARGNRVCSYDRAGHGWSDRAGLVPPERVVADLHTLLQTAEESIRIRSREVYMPA